MTRFRTISAVVILFVLSVLRCWLLDRSVPAANPPPSQPRIFSRRPPQLELPNPRHSPALHLTHLSSVPRPRPSHWIRHCQQPRQLRQSRDCSYAAYDGSRSDHSRNRRYRHCVRNNTAACAEPSAKDYDVSIEYDVSIKVEGPEDVESTVIEARVSGEDIHVTQLESTRTENWANWARSEPLFVDGAVFLRPLGGQ